MSYYNKRWANALATQTLVPLLLLVAGPATADAFAWKTASPESQGMDGGQLERLTKDLAEQRTTGLLIIRHDHIVMEWYSEGFNADKPHYTASLAKAVVGGMSLLLALDDGRIDLDDPACKYIPSWKDDPRKSMITIRHLATHTSGVEDAEEGDKPHDELTGWKGDFWKRTPDPFSIAVHKAPVLFEQGHDYAYSNPGMAALAYAVTASLQDAPEKDIRMLLKARVMDPIGVPSDAWSIGYGRTYEVEGLPLVANWGGGSYTARAVARVGRLMLRKGDWQGKSLIDPAWVEKVLAYAGMPRPDRSRGEPGPGSGASWWINFDGIWPMVPRDAFAGAGAGNQVLLVVPSLDLIVVRNGGLLGDPDRGVTFWGGLEQYLFSPIMAAVEDRISATSDVHPEAPYPPSHVIKRLTWAPASTIVRRAEGSDNWPVTWADDGDLYAAYGDGWGFEPKVPVKLSLGLARISGPPDRFVGANIRSASGEQTGDGKAGKKASGMLMVDGTLYMWVRNADNAQLTWSADQGKTWTWSDWRLTTSFGYPTFLNFGKNYAGARDRYVYVYSHDGESAYAPADRMVLARVPKDQLKQRNAYEFFERLDGEGRPVWTRDISKRGAVFEHKGHCCRSAITYNAPLKRYLWCQIPRSSDDTRFEGGLAIYDAPDPWGPWTTVYFTELWDVGPGETASIPTKWISDDGTSVHMVFSGDDYFSVRKATLTVVR